MLCFNVILQIFIQTFYSFVLSKLSQTFQSFFWFIGGFMCMKRSWKTEVFAGSCSSSLLLHSSISMISSSCKYQQSTLWNGQLFFKYLSHFPDLLNPQWDNYPLYPSFSTIIINNSISSLQTTCIFICSLASGTNIITSGLIFTSDTAYLPPAK